MKKILLFAVGIMLLGACKKENSSADKYSAMATNALLAVSSNASASAGVEPGKPFNSSGEGTISYIPGGCGAGTMQLVSSGTGNSTHMGAFTQSTLVCLNPATGQLLAQPTGIGVASNGDNVNYLFVGAGVNGDGKQFQNYVINGGTGRFANATGSMTLVYDVRTPLNYAYTGTGTINY